MASNPARSPEALRPSTRQRAFLQAARDIAEPIKPRSDSTAAQRLGGAREAHRTHAAGGATAAAGTAANAAGGRNPPAPSTSVEGLQPRVASVGRKGADQERSLAALEASMAAVSEG